MSSHRPAPPSTPIDGPSARAARRDADADGRRRLTARRRRAGAALVLLAAAVAVVLVAVLAGGGRSAQHATAGAGGAPSGSRMGSGAGAPPPHRPYAVGVRVLRFVDSSRSIALPSGRAPRSLVTVVRYPALGTASANDLSGAPAARAAGPFPLIVFGHGFAVTPALYRQLLHAWAQAGYVVAAPLFPLEQANAPGGPNEDDLANQPQDMRIVISRVLALSAGTGKALSGVVDAKRIAVAGQSDGGDTALAVAYDKPYRDPRVHAAAILSGAEIPGVAFAFPRTGSVPLLATQGTNDVVNKPSDTHAFYDYAPRPKFLLSLLGAAHLPPYSTEQPQLGIVERVTIAFFDAYLRGRSDGIAKRLTSLGDVAGVSAVLAQP